MTGADLPLLLVAGLIAAAGTWWFRAVLKDWLLRQEKPLRFGLYALIWLAYFILIIFAATRTA